MKKLIFAFVMISASISLVFAPVLQAQDSITIKDQAEFNSYQDATQQTDPAAKASALEGFLQAYPSSVVKGAVLDMLIDTYQRMNDVDRTLGAASRMLQVEPNNMKAIYIAAFIKKNQCTTAKDMQACDDAALLAQKGLAVPKPEGTSSEDWKKLIGAAYPFFHSVIAFDNAVSKKDFKDAVSEYTAELMLYTDEQTKTIGLPDTLRLAEAYAQPGPGKDLVKSVWFYARAWNFATPNYKDGIEKSLEYYYKRYHGNLNGLDEVKSQAALATFPPQTFTIIPAPTPAEVVHKLILETRNLGGLALDDKEYILAVGSKEDTDKLWSVLKNQLTPIPGVVIEATDSVIKIAVSQDAQEAKVADFIVKLKTPLAVKDIPAPGFVFGLQPKVELDGIYDTFTQVPATDTTEQAAQIVLRDGVIVPERKKAAPEREPAVRHRRAR
jgi:hypothetical protein